MRKLQEIYDDQNLTHRAKAVYIYLADRADALHQCWPSIGTIARELSLSRSTVQRAIQIPVYDINTLVAYTASAVVRHDYL